MAQTTQTAAAREASSYLDRIAPNSSEAWEARRTLRNLEEADPVESPALRAWHVRMLAEYDAAGNYFGGAEHRAAIARIDGVAAQYQPQSEAA